MTPTGPGRCTSSAGDGDDPAIAGKPAALEAYFKDYLEFNETSLQQAPPEIRDEWEVS